jgi:hypothetical protein
LGSGDVRGGDRVRYGSQSRGRRGSGDEAHCAGGERTRVPHRIPPPPGFGEAQTDSPPALTVIYGFASWNPPSQNLTRPKFFI